MAWAEGRRLQSVTQNGQTHSYQYNADGLRIKKTNPDGTYIVYHIADGRYVGETHYNELNHRVKYLRYTYDENDRVCGIGVWYAGQSQAWEEYYFETNLQGDVIAVYTAANGTNELPQLVASYTYDAWGNILTSTGSLADLNPFRYRGYYYDAETEFYYLQSRYYDPAIGRFINADGYVSTGQDFTGYNMFAYCGNNPANYHDNLGTRYEISAGAGVHGDVSEEIFNALTQAVIDAKSYCFAAKTLFGDGVIYESAKYLEFYTLVDHKAPWDIKRSEQWIDTIKTAFPGEGLLVTFGDMRMTPENLGNYTYGFLGYAYEIPYEHLIFGSYYAANFPTGGDALTNEVFLDWPFIWLGYESAKETFGGK